MSKELKIALTLLTCASLSQQAVAHDYYPLAQGNEWFYRSVGSTDSTVGASVRVVGDSVLSNGHQYFILSQNDIMGSRYVRTDSNSVFYLNPYTGQEQRVFNLNSQLGDTVRISWGPFATTKLVSIDSMNIFGVRYRVLTFEVEGLLYAVLRFCERFGPMTEWRYSDPPPPWPEWGRELVGCSINGIQYGHTLDVTQVKAAPTSFELYQNYPNPFNPETEISFLIPFRSTVTLRVFDITGKEIRTLIHQIESAGIRTVRWDGRDANGNQVSSGVYLYELTAASTRQAKRMLLLR